MTPGVSVVNKPDVESIFATLGFEEVQIPPILSEVYCLVRL